MAKELLSMTEERAKDLIKADRSASEEFFRTLASEDALGMVVRAHIQLESILQGFIRLMAPCPQEVKFGAMDFDQMLQLALILGLDNKLKPSLSATGYFGSVIATVRTRGTMPMAASFGWPAFISKTGIIETTWRP